MVVNEDSEQKIKCQIGWVSGQVRLELLSPDSIMVLLHAMNVSVGTELNMEFVAFQVGLCSDCMRPTYGY